MQNPRLRLAQQGLLSFLPLLAGVLVAWIIVSIVLHIENADSGTFWDTLYQGAWGDPGTRSRVITFWMPLLLVSSGLLLTFSAGLWNIGVEGQLAMGAVGATMGALWLNFDSRTTQIMAELALAAAAGSAWGLLVGILKTRGGINEIFGGVALNFIAALFSAFLISGPWMPERGGTGSRTEPFLPDTILPTITESQPFPFNQFMGENPGAPWRWLVTQIEEYRFLTPVMVYLGVGIFLVVAVILYFTRFGLQLKAIGKSPASAKALGIPTERNLWLALALCGGMAGLAGGLRVIHISVRALQANSSGGIGFLGLLVVLLVSFRPWLVPIVSFVFSFLITGALRVESVMKIDSSLVSVLQGVLVFFVLLFDGLRQKVQDIQERRAVAAEAARLAQEAAPQVVAASPEVTHG